MNELRFYKVGAMGRGVDGCANGLNISSILRKTKDGAGGWVLIIRKRQRERDREREWLFGGFFFIWLIEKYREVTVVREEGRGKGGKK